MNPNHNTKKKVDILLLSEGKGIDFSYAKDASAMFNVKNSKYKDMMIEKDNSNEKSLKQIQKTLESEIKDTKAIKKIMEMEERNIIPFIMNH